MSSLRLITILLLSLSGYLASAQALADTTISFVNFYPGSEIYELEGHSVLRIELPDEDIAISYGTYDFRQPNFVYRFVKGETDYWVTAMPWDYVAASYTREGRRIVCHRLDLTSDQKKAVIDLVAENLRPENRTYRYNYVKDNCATRPLDIVRKAVGPDSIVLGAAPAPLDGRESFRSIMRHYHRNYPWYQFGIDLALGSGIDYTLTNNEKSFAPALLDSQLSGATVGGRPLVTRSEVVNDAAPDAAVLGPTPFLLSPLFVCWMLFIIIVAVTFFDFRRHSESKLLDSLLFGIFGLAGCVVAFLVFISVHEATSPNLILLWLNPLCLIPAIFVWINRCKVIVFSYQIVNFVFLMCLLILAACGVQTLNAAFVPLILADASRAILYIYLNSNIIKCRK